jgi:Uma2 family endonuclease
MRPMSLQTTDEILNAVDHLPIGASLVMHGVSWEDYEHLLTELEERPHFRVSFDRGRLEIMSPSARHERYARFLDGVVREFANAHKLAVEMVGQTTWKRALARGVEPDCCYYVKNVDHIIARDLDLETDPPPDIAVEIDLTNSSLRKLNIYAALGVPEMWRFNGKALQVYELSGGQYVEIDAGRFLPGLTGRTLGDLINRSWTVGQTQALEEFPRNLQSPE